MENNPETTTTPKKQLWKPITISIVSTIFAALILYIGLILVSYGSRTIDPKTGVKTFHSDPDFVSRLPFSVPIYDFFQGIFGDRAIELTGKDDEKVALESLSENRFRSSTWFSDYKTMKANVRYYNEIHPFIYGMKGGVSNNGELVSSWSKTSKIARVKELRQLNPSLKIIPTIFRWENKREKITENIGMKGRTDIMNKHIQIIVDEVMEFDYDGIDIDYEGMTCEKKTYFEKFIKKLADALHKKGKLLSAAVHPKTASKKVREKTCKGKKVKTDFAENWRGPLTHDYEFLGKHVDRLKIMAYELHPRKYHNPGPGPQAPNVWLEDIIEYAVKRVPSQKLYMAIPTYGYDWALNCKARNARAVYHSTVLRIKEGKYKQFQPTNIEKIFEAFPEKSKTWKNLAKFKHIHKDKTYEDPSLWYRDEGCDRVAFFMNKQAFKEKMNLLRSYNLAGFSFWQLLSNNDPGINEYLSLLVTNQLPPIPLAKKKIEQLENKVDTPDIKTKDKDSNHTDKAMLEKKKPGQKIPKDKLQVRN